MSNIVNIIYFILILSVIIIVHELGHLIAAKRFGVYCKEFSIGMGPVVYQKQVGETAWSIRALPIGGFVAMAGEEDDDEAEELDIPYERTLNGIKPWKQIVVMAAGAIMNVLLAWVLFIGITAYQGAVSVPGKALVASVQENSAAEKGGMKAGDEIIRVKNGNEVLEPKTFNDVVEFIQYYNGDTEFTVLRDGKQVTLHFTPTYVKDESKYILGVLQQNEIKEISLGKLVQGVGLKNLSGPVGIYQVTAQITQTGLLSTIALIGLLSVNVGIFNLLPIPILDGGRIFIVLIETLIGRKLNERIQSAIMMAGLLMIVGIMVLATWNDISRLF